MKKTVREWFEECLPEDIREKAIANMKKSDMYDRKLGIQADTFLDALLGSFIFSYSKEGYKYWNDVLVKYTLEFDPLEFQPEDPFK